MKVLVICHGNINRSPLVAALLNRQGVKARSAGFKNPNRRAAKKMREAAKQLFHVDLEAHRSRAISRDLWTWADLILYMDGGNKQRLLQFKGANPDLPDRPMRLLANWSRQEPRTRIPDPHFTPAGPEFNKLVDHIGSAANSFAAWAKGQQ